MASILFLCTGNAARSVMAGAILRAALPDAVATAGTHVVDGQPMSWRTRDALSSLGLEVPGHRSAQLTETSLGEAELIVAMATEHVSYVRRRHPDAAPRTGTLRRVVRDLPTTGTAGTGPPLTERVAALGLAAVELEPWEDVDDPAGGEVQDYVACASALDGLVRALATELGGVVTPPG